jgi:hypothetical protein
MRGRPRTAAETRARHHKLQLLRAHVRALWAELPAAEREARAAAHIHGLQRGFHARCAVRLIRNAKAQRSLEWGVKLEVLEPTAFPSSSCTIAHS